MEHIIIEKLLSILREYNFVGIANVKSSTSRTITAQQGNVRAVFHLNSGEDVPSSMAMPHSNGPSSRDVAIAASFPGLGGATGLDALRRLRQGGTGD
jgi:hypothetical protein